MKSLSTRCDREDPKTMEVKTGLVEGLPPGRLVSEEFSIKGRLAKIPASNGHRATICFEEKVRRLTCQLVLKTKDLVGPQANPARAHLNGPAERVGAVEPRSQLIFS